MSNIVLSNVPEYLAKYVNPQGDMDQFGHLEPSDFALNIIKIVQAMSPQVRAGWGPTRQEPPLPLGTMFLSRDCTVIQPDTDVVPLCRSTRYIYWDGKPGDGKLVFMTDDRNDPRIRTMDGLAFRTDPVSKKTLPPLVTTFINFYVMIRGIEVPCVLSFKRTSMQAGRKLTQDLLMATKGSKLPMFGFVYTLKKPIEVIEGTRAWYTPIIVPNGTVPPEAIEKVAKMAEVARGLSAAATIDQFVESEEEHDDKLKNVTPPAAPAAPAPVPTAPAATPAAPAAPAVPPVATTVQAPSKLW